MQTLPIFLKRCGTLILSLVLLLAASACSTQVAPTAAPAVVMTRIVTREVTRVVEVPVTVTPAPTLAPTATLDPSAPPVLPQAMLPQYTDCVYGPAEFYVYKTSFPAGQPVDVLGVSEDGNWLEVQEAGGWNACWVQVGQVQFEAGSAAALLVVAPFLPRSEYEFGSPLTTTARREGDVVTVSWEAVFMSVDEVQGYLIDAYVCQDGQYLHLPVFVAKTYEENTGILSVQITDEAGCAELSKARIISMGTRGFAEWEKIFWPTH